ncbi:MAG TPA: uracil-DNA glycosylase family protein [Paraburkholderia sp.]|jgi:DNA polymerase|nr:uracil-DNA glycosylase family protein [Paraburkholderia sp.]
MALHESVLEEFGIAPMWVRRGMAVAPGAQTDVAADVAAERERVQPASTGSASGAPNPSLAQDGGRPPARAEQRQAQPDAPVANERPMPDTAARSPAVVREQNQFDAQPSTRPGEPRDRERSPVARENPVHTNDASSSAQTDGRRAQAPQSTPKPAQPARTPDPQPFDAPPEDDFAWFDDLPSEPPGHARSDAPQPPAIQTLDWDALSERVAACELCRLCEKRTNTVFGVGDRNADWMLIGEAPGENEDRQGEPFVGQAGKLLDNMLQALTLARDTNVYIANVIKCRPPGNRNPEQDELARCEPYLQRQVALVKPKLIVALGRFAAQSLLKTEASIASLRGRVHEYEGVPVIVTYHPAYLLRSLPDKAKAWTDLCLARDTWVQAGGMPLSATKK